MGYAVRTIQKYLNSVLPKDNTDADDNTITNEEDTTNGTGDMIGTNNVSMDVVEETDDANLPVDTSITLYILAKQTALTEVERLLCWLVVYKHHNIDNKNDLQRLQWVII